MAHQLELADAIFEYPEIFANRPRDQRAKLSASRTMRCAWAQRYAS